MKKTTLVILMLLVGFAGFAMQKKKKKKTKNSNEIVSVTIHRTTCFGRCPDYIIQLDKDGTAIYTGIRFTEDTGIFKKNVGKTKVQDIFSDLTTNRVDTCKEVYENRIPDLPGLIISIKYANRTKMIHNAHFGPAFLQRIATSIDEAGKKTDKSWKKTGMPKTNY